MNKLFTLILFTAMMLVQGQSQTMWTKNINNPVFTLGASGTWDDELVAGLHTMYDGSIYHGWYAGYDGTGTNIGYVSSMDGISWYRHSGPVLENGANGTWDDFVVYQPSVLYDGENYHMWFGGHNGNSNRQIGYATSPDSINWTKHSGNPVLTPGALNSWDDVWVDSPYVLFIDGIYHMWYSGNDGVDTQIGHATSSDGITWNKDAGNPVVAVGQEGLWDNFMTYQPSVLIDRNNVYHMFYSGGESFKWSVGYAYSEDGLNWTKYEGNPIMEPGADGSWDNTYTGIFTVSFNADSSVFKMWYTGGNNTVFTGGQIGYATSPLIPADNLVFPRGTNGQWDDQFVSGPSIFFENNTYHMWYSGFDGGSGQNIGYANSQDGINWIRYSEPVLQSENINGSWDRLTVFQPSVLVTDTLKHMWFSGHNGISSRQIGYATATDSIHWSKHPDNPVLGPGSPGSWDDVWVDSPDVLFIGGVYHMWYSGSDGTYTRIGHATSPDGKTWTKDPANPVLYEGPAGKWDDLSVGGPSVNFDGELYRMWYGGGQEASFDWKIGYAESSDGSNWIKKTIDNPVFGLGSPGSWNEKFVNAGGVEIFLNEDLTKFQMWYGGGTGFSIGDIGYYAGPLDNIIIVNGIENFEPENKPLAFILNQNYPNPFNPKTHIEYRLTNNDFVTLSIYNMLGQKAATLVDEKQAAGSYRVQWDATGFSSGVYFYSLETNQGLQKVRKLVLLK